MGRYYGTLSAALAAALAFQSVVPASVAYGDVASSSEANSANVSFSSLLSGSVDEGFDASSSIDLLADLNGWIYDGDNRYYVVDSKIVKGSRYIDGSWYRFDLETGRMLTGWQEIDGHRYYYDLDSGAMLFDNQCIDGQWYLFDETQGYMLTGWQSFEGHKYYYDPVAGSMAFGLKQIAGKQYLFDETQGYMLTGWQELDGETYYFDPNSGEMYLENHCIDGEWYWFDWRDGHMWTGSAYIYGNWYRYDLEDGHMLFGSQYIDGDWYRYDPAQGYMLFGSQYIDGNWYRYDLVDGKMKFGWQNIDGKEYYYDPIDGKMYFGEHRIDGQLCIFHETEGYLIYAEVAQGSFSLPYTFDEAVENQLSKGLGYTEEQYRKYMDPGNFDEGSKYYYQFAKLNEGYTGISSLQLDMYISKNCVYQEAATGKVSSLRGLGSAIVEVSKRTGVNEVYILAHAILESGWGCSALSTGSVKGYEGYYNFYGIGAYDSDPLNAGAAMAKNKGWTSPALAIQGGASWIDSNYMEWTCALGNGTTTTQDTLYKMRFAPGLSNTYHQYATDIMWASSISSVMAGIYDSCGVEPNLTYEIPLYLK